MGANTLEAVVGDLQSDKIETVLGEPNCEMCSSDEEFPAWDPAEEPESPELMAPPDGRCSWDWPLSRNEKKTRLVTLERNLKLLDQHAILEELKELREFRRCHEEASERQKSRKSCSSIQ